MKMVMVGGHTRNIGKTSVIEGIIRAMPDFNWTAVKITQFGHSVCTADGEACDCADANHPFVITTEQRRDSGTDTSRFLVAGARRSLWLRTRQGDLFTALGAFRNEIRGDQFVIVESNSLRRFMKPTVYLQVVDPGNGDFKDSARSFFDLADAYLTVAVESDSVPAQFAEETLSVLLDREIGKGKPLFSATEVERFTNDSLVDFVHSGVELGPDLHL